MRIALSILLFTLPLESAEVSLHSNPAQNQGLTSITLDFLNNDNGAVYNSATFDLVTSFVPVLQAISDNHPGHLGHPLPNIASNIGLTIRGAPTGEVNRGWSPIYSPTTGLISFTNNGFIPDGTYDVWRATQQNPNRDELALSLNLGSLLDFNQNNQTDPEETLLTLPTPANDGFYAFMGVQNEFYASTPRFALTSQLNPTLAITSITATEITLTFPTQTAFFYTLQSSPDLNFTAPHLTEQPTLTGTGSLPRTTTPTFYRLLQH
ncbi:MAG: hypothetical protein AAGC74_04180 [Verrucomicrobiota bacterium]